LGSCSHLSYNDYYQNIAAKLGFYFLIMFDRFISNEIFSMTFFRKMAFVAAKKYQ